MRQYSAFDRWLISVDEGCKLMAGFYARPDSSHQEPAEQPSLTEQERRHSAALMRVNHAGEIAAQGLYQGQALTARSTARWAYMRSSAHQEEQHLRWCAERLQALHSHPSVLTPLWYCGSFGIGCLAGLMGDRWSLGFMKETEDQVVEHLSAHLQRAPCQDKKTIDIIERIKIDEAEHAQAASAAGGADVPIAVKKLMRYTAKIMTSSAYYF